MSETATLTLTDFLLARIAEDEDAFNSAVGESSIGQIVGNPPRWFKPPRVLAECEAKRRIVREYEILRSMWVDKLDPGIGVGFHALGKCLEALALPYADHPDYREEWRP